MQQELLDVLDETGTHTGRTVVRGTPLQPGEFHIAVHVWLRDTQDVYLIQQRALHLASGPGIWATTVGYVQAGEESLPAALRETQEELGLVLAAHDLQFFQRVTTGSLIQDVWLAVLPDQPHPAIAIGEDVAAVKLVTKREIEEMIRRHEFFPYSYFAELPK